MVEAVHATAIVHWPHHNNHRVAERPPAFRVGGVHPALANLVTIGALVVAGQLVGENSLNAYKADRTAVLVVGLGTTAGYFVQLLAQLPALFRAESLCVRVGNLITPRYAPYRVYLAGPWAPS